MKHRVWFGDKVCLISGPLQKVISNLWRERETTDGYGDVAFPAGYLRGFTLYDGSREGASELPLTVLIRKERIDFDRSLEEIRKTTAVTMELGAEL